MILETEIRDLGSGNEDEMHLFRQSCCSFPWQAPRLSWRFLLQEPKSFHTSKGFLPAGPGKELMWSVHWSPHGKLSGSMPNRTGSSTLLLQTALAAS
jgi:hypothetical protein